MTTAAESGGSPPAVIYERQGHVAVVTLNRPRALNAINAEMATRLDEALSAIDSEPDVWVGVISGGAAPVFCAGADLKELAAGRSVAPRGREEAGLGGVLGRFVSKPLIAAVNGPAFGGGTELALACDLVVAATDASFALPEVQRGIMAAAGGLVRLPRQVPLHVALETVLTGQPMTAQAAERWGLVNRIVARDEVLPCALRLADLVCANAPLAVQASKRVLYRSVEGRLPEDETAWDINVAEGKRLRMTEDAREGPRAFAERRPPVWQAR